MMEIEYIFGFYRNVKSGMGWTDHNLICLNQNLIALMNDILHPQRGQNGVYSTQTMMDQYDNYPCSAESYTIEYVYINNTFYKGDVLFTFKTRDELLEYYAGVIEDLNKEYQIIYK